MKHVQESKTEGVIYPCGDMTCDRVADTVFYFASIVWLGHQGKSLKETHGRNM